MTNTTIPFRRLPVGASFKFPETLRSMFHSECRKVSARGYTFEVQGKTVNATVGSINVEVVPLPHEDVHAEIVRENGCDWRDEDAAALNAEPEFECPRCGHNQCSSDGECTRCGKK